MGVPRRTAVKNRPSSERVLNPELGVMLPNLPADHGSSTGEVWSGIWTITKYVLFFCLGMVVGALFLHSNDVQKKCFESMVAIGFSSQRGREICYKNQPSISGSFRFDCMPRNANAQDCKKRGCIWDESVQGVPYCYFPDKYGSYSNANVTIEKGLISAYMHKKIKSPYPEDVDILLFEACSETESRLHVKITDVSRDRFEPFYPKVPDFHCKTLKNSQFQVKISEGKMGFKVLRSSNNRVIFDSEDIGSLIYANQFLQVNARLPSGSVLYGIGERQSPMHINNGTFQTFTLWNRDAAPTDKINLYGSHPFLLIREPFDQPESFKWHGLFFLNSNAMDIITQPGPAITFRTIGGILDFYWFMGETPSLVTQQYFEVIGRPRMPPYWALGFHLCRFGYESLDKTIVVWNRTRSAGIPFDVQWNDLDYMDHNNDFTVSPKFEKLPEFVNMLHSIGMHYIPLIDPGVSAGEKKGQYEPYDYGIELNIFVEDENKKPFMGKVWNSVSTVWPDFTNPQTILYWLQMLRNLHDKVPFDGAWIDMNEPSNFYSGSKNGCAKNSLNYPPYVPNVLGGQLFSNTLCPSSKQYKGLHYDLHNLYGISEAVVTSFVLENIRDLKRPVTISRSTFPGHGHYAAHWTGDVFSTWSDMKLSIAQMLMFNMFGIPFVGADICGFNGNTTAELCARWSQLGAFYPFSRNHNSDDTIEQDPVALGSTVVNAAKRALEIRYSLLPYLYYLFFDAHVHGKTVARPVFYEFPNDVNTHQLESQFMWGSCILFVPVLDEGKVTVNGYFPAGMWYDWNTNDTLNVDKSLLKTLSAPLDTIPLFVRGGCILPTQLPKATTTESRQTPVTLKVYLDHNGSGHGSAYFDDGDFVYAVDEGNYTLINYSAKDKTLIGSPVKAKFSTIPPLKTVIIHGDCDDVVHVTVNNKETNKFFFNKKACILSVQVNASLLEALKISWKG